MAGVMMGSVVLRDVVKTWHITALERFYFDVINQFYARRLLNKGKFCHAPESEIIHRLGPVHYCSLIANSSALGW